MTDRRWHPDMTESPSTGSGQSSVLCPDGLPVYREILRPYNAVTQSVHNRHLLSIHIFQHYRSRIFSSSHLSTTDLLTPANKRAPLTLLRGETNSKLN